MESKLENNMDPTSLAAIGLTTAACSKITRGLKLSLKMGTFLLISITLLAALPSKAQESSYTKDDIKAYGEAFGQYLAAITSLRLLNEGECAFSISKMDFNFDKALNRGLSSLPADLRPEMRKTFLEQKWRELNTFATNTFNQTKAEMAANTDERTACGFMAGLAASRYQNSQEKLVSLADRNTQNLRRLQVSREEKPRDNKNKYSYAELGKPQEIKKISDSDINLTKAEDVASDFFYSISNGLFDRAVTHVIPKDREGFMAAFRTIPAIEGNRFSLSKNGGGNIEASIISSNIGVDMIFASGRWYIRK